MFKNHFEAYENLKNLYKVDLKLRNSFEEENVINALDLIALHTELFTPCSVIYKKSIKEYLDKTFYLNVPHELEVSPTRLIYYIFYNAKKLPERYFQLYSNFYCWKVREEIAKNSNTPLSVLRFLETDVDDVVGFYAIDSLRKRVEQ